MLVWVGSLFSTQLLSKGSLDPKLRTALRRLIKEIQQIYREAADRCVREFPQRINASNENFHEKMEDLHRGVLLKSLISVAWCDRYLTDGEKEAAQIVLKHVWNVNVCSDTIKQSFQAIVGKADSLKWPELYRPFLDIWELREYRAELISTTIRLASVIAKADEEVSAQELVQLTNLKRALSEIASAPQPGSAAAMQKEHAPSAFAPLKLDHDMISTIHDATTSPRKSPKQLPRNSIRSSGGWRSTDTSEYRLVENSSQRLQPLVNSVETSQATTNAAGMDAGEESCPSNGRAKVFDEGMKELEAMIGLESIKNDVRQLVDFLKMRQAREKAKLPVPQISLHTLFTGNPGTGKTTVARIIGKLFYGLGILDQGHTIEADRSALVAQYAGQTAPKVHECIDRALDGVLFIDEAYSLVSGKGDDAYGTEAVQVLLKRMEDDRERLIVVLAGYPEPMKAMLRTNPGLTSRFQRTLDFPDYSPEELFKIFAGLCRRYKYRMTKETQRQLYAGLQQLVAKKDEHFGNGRVARNLFEKSLQNMASRIVGTSPLTEALLTTIKSDDLEL